jgi:hypothetical protein
MVAWVGSMTNNGSAYGRLVSFSASADAADWNNTHGFNVGRVNLTTGLSLGYNSTGSGTFTTTYGSFFIAVVVFDGSNGYLYVNGALVGSFAATTNFSMNRMGLWRNASSTVDVGAGDFAELLTMNRAPTTTERQELEGYFASKFALQSVLPAGHPYKSAAP